MTTIPTNLPQHDTLSDSVFLEDSLSQAERARHMAAREFYEPDYSRKTVAPSLRIRVLDWLGNLPYRFDRWWDRVGLANQAIVAGAAIALGLFVSGVLAALTVMKP